MDDGMLTNRQLERRLAELDFKLDLILIHLGIKDLGPAVTNTDIATNVNLPAGTDVLNQVDRLLRQGKKIQAIKRYRELTGVSLKEAKEGVERREC